MFIIQFFQLFCMFENFQNNMLRKKFFYKWIQFKSLYIRLILWSKIRRSKNWRNLESAYLNSLVFTDEQTEV